MRVQSIGLAPLLEEDLGGLAQLQAALTHAHPAALAAAELTAQAVRDLASGAAPLQVLDALIERAEEGGYCEAWLGDFWAYGHDERAETYLARGWQTCREALERVRASRDRALRMQDPCALVGEGWCAEEALSAAMLSFLWFEDEPERVLWRAAVSSGDSDSIACLAGAFAGAYHGLAAWPRDWLDRVEYNRALLHLSDELATWWDEIV